MTFNNPSSLSSVQKGSDVTEMELSGSIRRGESGYSLKAWGPAAQVVVKITPHTAQIPADATHIGFWVYSKSSGSQVINSQLQLIKEGVGVIKIGEAANDSWTYLSFSIEEAKAAGYLTVDADGNLGEFSIITNTNMGTGTVEIYVDEMTYVKKTSKAFLYGVDAPKDGITFDTPGLDWDYGEGEGNRISYTGTEQKFSVSFDIGSVAAIESITLNMWQDAPTHLYIGDGTEEWARFGEYGSFGKMWNTDPGFPGGPLTIQALQKHVEASGVDVKNGKVQITLMFPDTVSSVYWKNIVFTFYE